MTRVIVASVLVAVATAWAAVALARAARIDMPSGRGAPHFVGANGVRVRSAAVSAHDTLVAAAIEVDPFSPEREPPATRYGSASITADSPATQVPAQQAVLKLVGTVIDADGSSFAMCQLGDAQPRAIRVGDRIGEYRLRAVRQGAADFTGPDGPITLRVPPPAP